MNAQIQLELQPAHVAEWDAEDKSESRLGQTEVEWIDASEMPALMSGVQMSLPADIDYHELAEYAAKQPTPLNLDLPLNTKDFSYFLVSLPLSILVPQPRRLCRLKIVLELKPVAGQKPASKKPTRPVVIYDLYPGEKVEEREINLGTMSVDVTKALMFINPVAGAAVSNCLGLKLDIPVKWKSALTVIQATGRMNTQALWDVTDKNIEHGFNVYVIVRVPKGIDVEVSAQLSFELRQPGLVGFWKKAHLKAAPQSYLLTK